MSVPNTTVDTENMTTHYLHQNSFQSKSLSTSHLCGKTTTWPERTLLSHAGQVSFGLEVQLLIYANEHKTKKHQCVINTYYTYEAKYYSHYWMWGRGGDGSLLYIPPVPVAWKYSTSQNRTVLANRTLYMHRCFQSTLSWFHVQAHYGTPTDDMSDWSSTSNWTDFGSSTQT